MIVLGIDCATKWTNVGIVQDGVILCEISIELARKQASELPILVEKALADSAVHLPDIDLISVAKGPGYYTGIRTGIAYSAALARALGVRIVPLSTMEIFVHDLKNTNKYIAPILKARSKSVYAAIYESNGENLNAIMEPSYISASQFAEKIDAYPDAVVVGTDRNLYPEIMLLNNKYLERQCACGGQTALLGYLKSQNAVAPYKIKGEYLREPDIGATQE